MTNNRSLRVARMRAYVPYTRKNQQKSALRKKEQYNSSPKTTMGWQYGQRRLIQKKEVLINNVSSEHHTPGELPNRNDPLRESRYSINASAPRFVGSVSLSPNEARLYANVISKQLNTRGTLNAIKNINTSSNIKEKLWSKYVVDGYTNNNNNNINLNSNSNMSL